MKHKLAELLPVYGNRGKTIQALKIISQVLYKGINDYGKYDKNLADWTNKMTKIMLETMPKIECNGYRLRSYSHSHCDKKSTSVKEYYEYLIDYTWSYEIWDGKEKDFFGLALAMEVEWGGTRDAVWADFYKLADIKADLKIFVAGLQVNLYNKEQSDLINSMSQFLSQHLHFKDDEKILVIFCSNSTKSGDSEWVTSYILGNGLPVKLKQRS